MPAGHLLTSQPDSLPLPVDSLQLQQAKRCNTCQGPLNADLPVSAPSSPQIYSQDSGICNVCREARLVQQQQRETLMVCSTPSLDGPCDIDVPLRVLQRNNNPIRVDNQHEAESSSSDEDAGLHDEDGDNYTFISNGKSARVGPPSGVSQTSVLPVLVPISTSSSAAPSTFSSPPYPQRNLSPISFSPSTLRFAPPGSPVRQTFHSPTSDARSSLRTRNDHDHDDGYPDPLVDITRLRVRSKGYRCLQPGATFKGTQKSGRNSYDVNVTIVDVDFASSSLCGYLRIRGLTDDWPELTTYFDAQIIGMRHGFETGDWGASLQEDLVHWARFPSFGTVQKDLIEPRKLLPANTARPAVFMRWKERFLVPDHRVEDVSGASFAGFYYVCVEFEPTPPAPPSPQTVVEDLPVCVESGHGAYQVDTPYPHVSPSRHHASGRKPQVVPTNMWDEEELSANGEPPRARMCGFYYHKNSEPYQQLSVTHAENRFHSSFEFR